MPWTSITSKLDSHCLFFLLLDRWTVCLNGGLIVVYIIKPQVDTPWFYQALFISASDHNTLWGSLWEIQMSGRVKINRGSSETWVRLNWISSTCIPYPRWLAINPAGIELYSHTHAETWAWLSCSSETSTNMVNILSLPLFKGLPLKSPVAASHYTQRYELTVGMVSKKAERGLCMILINSGHSKRSLITSFDGSDLRGNLNQIT